MSDTVRRETDGRFTGQYTGMLSSGHASSLACRASFCDLKIEADALVLDEYGIGVNELLTAAIVLLVAAQGREGKENSTASDPLLDTAFPAGGWLC